MTTFKANINERLARLNLNSRQSSLEDVTKNMNALTDYRVIKELGRGAFAVVNKVVEKKNPKKVFALKNISLGEELNEAQALKEYDIMMNLKHPNVIEVLQ